MRRTSKATIGLAALVTMALTAAGCGGSGGDGGDKTLTVWLMDGSAPKSMTKALNKQFEHSHKGWTVNYEVQEWDKIGDKLGKALSSSNPPDVLELGNTQAVQYSKAGTLMDVSGKAGELHGKDWLPALKKSGKWKGKQYAIPFYAANRIVIYRTDMFDKAGIEKPPTSNSEWLADLGKLNKAYADDPDFQSLYLPGQNWYALLSFIWDQGGSVATQSGDTWKGSLDTPRAKAGIEFYEKLVETSKTKAPKDTDEANPQEWQVFSQDGGHVAMMIGLPWKLKSAIEATPSLKETTSAFPIPSKTAGATAPVFLGGSDLAISAASTHQDAALDYLKLMTGDKYQKMIAESGSIPGTSNDTEALTGTDAGSAMVKASAKGKITPVTPNWAQVEAGNNPIKVMMTSVLTGKASLDKATRDTTTKLTTLLSGS